MKSFYKTKDKMREDFLQNEQEVMMKETFKDSRKRFKSLSKNAKMMLGIGIICLASIILFGGITIPNKNLYDMEFDFSITGVDIRTTVHTEYKKPIIPFLLYSTADEFGMYNSKTIEKGQSFNKLKGMGVYLLKVSAYRCYYINDDVNIGAGCGDYSRDSSLVNDPTEITKVRSKAVKYTTLRIIDRGSNDKVVYEGELIQDLSKYIYKPSTYAIFLYAEYGYSKAVISTTVEIEGE